MAIFDKFKLWYSCRITGRMKEYKEYKEFLELKQLDINRFRKYLDNAIQKFQNIKQRFSPDSKEYIDAKYEMQRWEHTLEEAQLSFKFIRPNSQQDIKYRDEQFDTFENKLQAVLSTNFDVRFHGTPIYYAEQIIKSGIISSTADRYDGYIKSTDRKGEISSSDRESIGTTIKCFSDMTAYKRALPAGCIFALLPKDKEDATYGQNLIHSVNFKQNPRQLFGIFTTPENIQQVKQWMIEAQFNPDLVYTFEEFLQTVKVKSDIIDKQVQFNDRVESPGCDVTQPINLQENNRHHMKHKGQGIDDIAK